MLNQTNRVTMFTTHFTDFCSCYNFASENSIQLFNDFRIFKYSGLFDYSFIQDSVWIYAEVIWWIVLWIWSKHNRDKVRLKRASFGLRWTIPVWTSSCKIGGDTRDDVRFKTGEKERKEGTKAHRIEIDTTGKADSLKQRATGSLKSLNTVTRYCVS